jgi:hypothetical protein
MLCAGDLIIEPIVQQTIFMKVKCRKLNRQMN